MQRNIALLPVKELKHPEMMWMESDEYRKDVLHGNIADSLHLNFKHFEKPSTQDKIYPYAKQLLCLGCLYMEFSDSIREGDG